MELCNSIHDILILIETWLSVDVENSTVCVESLFYFVEIEIFILVIKQGVVGF